MGINKVILVGNVGRDPELKSLPTGTQLVTFSLATSDRRNKDEQGNVRTEWHNIVMWGKLAEICDRYVRKGKLLYLEGQIRTRSWEQEGVKKYMTEVHCHEMEMLGGREGGGSGDPGPTDYGTPPASSSGGSFPNDADDVPF